MAKLICTTVLLVSYLLIAIISSTHAHVGAEEDAWLRNIRGSKESVAKVHFYVQDVLGGATPTVYEVARASITSNSTTSFGQVRVLDDKMTTGPEANSTTLGRLQGLITFADLETSALAMNLNFYFTSGKYNGSTLSILGRNQIMNAQREFPVVGGTGTFRFARGYALSSTYSYDVETNYGVLEYTMYVTYVSPKSSEARFIKKVADI